MPKYKLLHIPTQSCIQRAVNTEMVFYDTQWHDIVSLSKTALEEFLVAQTVTIYRVPTEIIRKAIYGKIPPDSLSAFADAIKSDFSWMTKNDLYSLYLSCPDIDDSDNEDDSESSLSRKVGSKHIPLSKNIFNKCESIQAVYFNGYTLLYNDNLEELAYNQFILTGLDRMLKYYIPADQLTIIKVP